MLRTLPFLWVAFGWLVLAASPAAEKGGGGGGGKGGDKKGELRSTETLFYFT